MNSDLIRPDAAVIPQVIRGLLESRDWGSVRQGIELVVALGGSDLLSALDTSVSVDDSGVLEADWFGQTGIRVKHAVRTQFALSILALGPTPRLASIEKLDLSGLTDLADLDSLRAATSLRVLRLAGCSGVRSGATLGALGNLETLIATDCPVLRDLPSHGMEGLRVLSGDLHGLSSLEPIRGLTGLRTLTLLNSQSVTDLSALGALRELRELRMFGVCAADLSPLASLGQLEEIELGLEATTVDLSHLAGLTRLRSIVISGYNDDTPLDIGRLLPEGALPLLESLVLSDFATLAGLDQIRGGTALREFRVSSDLDAWKFLRGAQRSGEGVEAVRGMAYLMVASAACRFGASADGWRQMEPCFEAAIRRGGRVVAERLLGTWQLSDGCVVLASSSPLRRIADMVGDAWLDDAVMHLIAELGWPGIAGRTRVDLSRMQINSEARLRSLPKGTRVQLAGAAEIVV